MYQHQDWNTIVFKKKKTYNNTENNNPKKNYNNSSTKIDTNMKKIDNENENFNIKLVSFDLSKTIIKARQQKKMTQKELAAAINEKYDIISSYESGKAIPNNHILNKMQKVLGVKLNGLNK